MIHVLFASIWGAEQAGVGLLLAETENSNFIIVKQVRHLHPHIRIRHISW